MSRQKPASFAATSGDQPFKELPMEVDVLESVFEVEKKTVLSHLHQEE